jgi:hypothetical protein
LVWHFPEVQCAPLPHCESYVQGEPTSFGQHLLDVQCAPLPHCESYVQGQPD